MPMQQNGPSNWTWVDEPDDEPTEMDLAPLVRLMIDARELSEDGQEVVALIAERMRHGQEQYGELDLESDERDYRREANEEWADAAVYAACDLLRRGRGR